MQIFGKWEAPTMLLYVVEEYLIILHYNVTH